MQGLVVWIGVVTLPAACTKPNPSFCCETEADCQAAGSSEIVTCPGGACVENTCVDVSTIDATPSSVDASMADCVGTGTWSAPIKLTGPSTAESESYPALSSTGLELFFAAPRNDKAGLLDVFVTERTLSGEPFGTARNTIFEIDTSTDIEKDPAISADGLELFFSGAGFIYRTRRSDPSEPWGPPEFTELTGNRPALLADGRTIYWYDSSAPCPTTCRMRATRDDAESAWTDLTVTRFPAGDYSDVQLSGDGLRVLLSDPATPASAPVAVACRSSSSASWGPAYALEEFRTSTNIRFARWSWDRSEMYFEVYESGQFDLYFSTYTP